MVDYKRAVFEPNRISLESSYLMGGGGTGKSFSATFTHFSPSSISMTGISSTIGYLRPQSWQINQLSWYSFNRPSVSRIQFGQRRISNNSWLIIFSPFSRTTTGYFTTSNDTTPRLQEMPGSLSRAHIGTQLARAGNGFESNP